MHCNLDPASVLALALELGPNMRAGARLLAQVDGFAALVYRDNQLIDDLFQYLLSCVLEERLEGGIAVDDSASWIQNHEGQRIALDQRTQI
jgi:hypothetical protein